MSNWWDDTEPPVKDLAQRIALRFGYSDLAQCLPYPSQHGLLPSGEVTHVRMSDLVPVWSQFVDLARMALATRDEQAVDAVMGTAPQPDDDLPVTFTDDPTAAWRKERGLDGEDQE